MAYYDVQVAPNSAFVPPRPASAPPPLCQNCGQFNPNSGQPNSPHTGCLPYTYTYAPVQAAPSSGFISPRPHVTVSFQIGPVGVAGAARTATAAGAQALLLNF